MDTADTFRTFADAEARGQCDLYEDAARRIGENPSLVDLIEELPESKRQPNLVLAATRFCGAPTDDAAQFVNLLRDNWMGISDVVLSRRTQTNEPARLATLLPVLSALPGPLALIEVGASAGLCLHPDRYSYRYDDRPWIHPSDGPSRARFVCETEGDVPIPRAVPTVVSRTGIDLQPVDLAAPEEIRWLEALIWPGQTERLNRLRAACAIAEKRQVQMVAGDLNDAVGAAVHAAPAEAASVVVFHSAVLSYLTPADRRRFVRAVTNLPCRWISNEAPGVVPGMPAIPAGAALPDVPTNTTGSARRGPSPLRFVLALDGRPVAHTGPHGQSIRWL